MSDHATRPVGVDRPRDHSFDGIEEYDNDLPRWWLAMLYLSMVFAILYTLHYHFGPGLNGPRRLEAEYAEIDRHRPRDAAGGYAEDQLRAFSRDPARAAHGKALATRALCVTCHNQDLTGLVGPNLRDAWWTYGSSMSDIVLSITKGRLNGVMPAQERSLTRDDIVDLACYIVQLNRQGVRESPIKKHDPLREKEVPIDY